jgi:hypothetical protein
VKFCHRLFKLNRLSLSLSLSLGSKPLSLSLRLQKLVELSLELRLAEAQPEPMGNFTYSSIALLYIYRYVSTVTMCVIGLDRHQALVHPFGKRLSAVIPIYVMIPFIWIISGLFSIPHAYFNEVVKLSSYRYLFRCQIRYPEPESLYRQWLTIITFSSQYLIPLSIATICYSKIAYNIHQRGKLGDMTQRQIDNSTRFSIYFLYY